MPSSTLRSALYTCALNRDNLNCVKMSQGDRARVSSLTGCTFCREHTLLSLALVEVQNKGRVWCRQKNIREAGGAMMTKCACSLPVLFVLSSGLLATYACIFFHYFNRLWRSEKLGWCPYNGYKSFSNS